jgi:hypothetical protein
MSISQFRLAKILRNRRERLETNGIYLYRYLFRSGLRVLVSSPVQTTSQHFHPTHWSSNTLVIQHIDHPTHWSSNTLIIQHIDHQHIDHPTHWSSKAIQHIDHPTHCWSRLNTVLGDVGWRRLERFWLCLKLHVIQHYPDPTSSNTVDCCTNNSNERCWTSLNRALRWLHTLFIIGGLVPNLEFSRENVKNICKNKYTVWPDLVN